MRGRGLQLRSANLEGIVGRELSALSSAIGASFHTLERSDIHLFAHWDALVVNQWLRHPTATRLESLGDHQQSLVERFGELSVITVWHELTPPPEEARRAATSVAESHADNIRAQAFVIARAGLGAAMIRMVLTGILLTARARAPSSVVSTPDEAVQWLAMRRSALPDGVSPDVVLRELESVLL